MAEKKLYFCELCGRLIIEEKRRGLRVAITSAPLNQYPDNKVTYEHNDICSFCHKKIAPLIKPLAEFFGQKWEVDAE